MNLLQSNYINPYVTAITNWQPSLDYVNGQIVIRNNATYICLSSHTSTDSFITDYFTNNKWQSLGAMISEVKALDTLTIPNGWLACDGAEYDKTLYADLYTIIGNTNGSTSTTFRVPNLNGRTPIGVGQYSFSTTFSNTDVNVSTNAITVASNTSMYTGRPILFTAGTTAPTGLTNNVTYFVVKVSNTEIKLATTYANAIAITPVVADITAQGVGTNTLSYTGSTRTLGEFGGEESHGITQPEMPAHTHNVTTGAGGSQQIWQTGSESAANDGSYTYTSTSVGGNAYHNNMMPYLALSYIIKF